MMRVLAVALLTLLWGFSCQAADGAKVYEKCIACHKPAGASAEMGPNLAGVVGRTAGTAEDYRFSPAMKRSGVVWDEASIDSYLANPQGFIKGNRMPFAGLPDKDEREAVIDYIKQLKP